MEKRLRWVRGKEGEGNSKKDVKFKFAKGHREGKGLF